MLPCFSFLIRPSKSEPDTSPFYKIFGTSIEVVYSSVSVEIFNLKKNKLSFPLGLNFSEISFRKESLWKTNVGETLDPIVSGGGVTSLRPILSRRRWCYTYRFEFHVSLYLSVRLQHMSLFIVIYTLFQ